MPFVKHGVLSERIDSIAFALYFDFNIDFVLGYFQLLLKKQKVQRHRKFKDTTVAEIESVMEQWLQRAYDRKGGLPLKSGKERHDATSMP